MEAGEAHDPPRLFLLHASLALAIGLARPAGASEGDPSPCEPDDAPLVVAWELGRADAPMLVVSSRAEPGRGIAVTLTATMALGPLRYEWQVAEVDVGPGESLVVEVEIPPSAFLHAEASRYVSDLVVRARSSMGTVTMEPVYVAWADPGRPPLVWDRAGMRTNAPYGLVDPVLRDQVEQLPARPDRVLPDIQVPVEDLDLEDTGLDGG